MTGGQTDLQSYKPPQNSGPSTADNYAAHFCRNGTSSITTQNSAAVLALTFYWNRDKVYLECLPKDLGNAPNYFKAPWTS